MLTFLRATRNMQPGTPTSQDSPALTRPPLHATTTFADHRVATIDGHTAAQIAGLPADGATAFRAFAGAGAIASDATPMSERRLHNLNDGAVAPDSTIDMAESSDDKPCEGLTDVEPVPEAQANPNLLEAPTSSGLDSGDDPWLAAGPSPSPIAEQPDDDAIDSDPEEFAQANPNWLEAPTNSGLDSGDDPWLAAGPSPSPIAEDPDDDAIDSDPEEFAQANPNWLEAPTSFGLDSGDDPWLAAGPSPSPIAEDPDADAIDSDPEEFAQANPNWLDAPTNSGGDSRENFGENSPLAAGPSFDIQGLDADNPVATSGEALASHPITDEELIDLALHAASTGAKMNCRDWVRTHLKHVIPTSLDSFVHPKKGTLNPVDLHKRLHDCNMLPGPTARQAVILRQYLIEHNEAIKHYMLFCIGIGLDYYKTNNSVTVTGRLGSCWKALMRGLEAEEQQSPPDPSFAKLLARLKYASLILYPQDPLRAQAAIASLHQAILANPSSARLAPAATLPAREKLASPGGRSIEHCGHQSLISVDECMEFARVAAVYGENLDSKDINNGLQLQPGRVKKLLNDLPVFQDTRVNLLDAPATSIPTPKRTSEHLSQNERSAKTTRMENVMSFPPDITIDMAESSDDKLERTTTAGPILEITQEILSKPEPETINALIKTGIDIGEDSSDNSRQAPEPSASPIAEQPADGAIYLAPELAQENQKLLDEPTNFEEDFWEDYGDNSRLAAEPSAPRIAEQSADGATALRPVAGAGAIASHATPMSARRRHIILNAWEVEPLATVAPGGSKPTPKRTGEHLSQNERSAKATRMEDVQSFALDSTIDMAGPSAPRIAEQPADGATAFRAFAGAGAIASDATPMSARRSYILSPWAVDPLATVAPGGSQPTPKRTGEHLSQNERSAKAPRMENVMPLAPDSTIDMTESSDDKLERTTTAGPILEITQEILSKPEPETINALIKTGIDIGEDSSDNSRQAPEPSASPIAEQPADGAIYLVPELAQANQKLLDEPTNFEEDFWEDYGDNSRQAPGPSADIQGLDTENPVVASSEARSPHPIIGQERMESARHAEPASLAQAFATSTLPREHKLPAPEKRQEETRPELGVNPSKPKSAFKLPEATQKEALGAKGLSILASETERIDGKAANPCDISDDELIRFGRAVAVYGDDPNITAWIKDQLKYFTKDSYIDFINSDGFINRGELQRYIEKNIRISPPTAQDIQELSNFIKIQCGGSVPSFSLLCYCLLLKEGSTKPYMQTNGELTGYGNKKLAHLSKNIKESSPPGRVQQLLNALPVFQNTRVNLLDVPATSIPTPKRTSERSAKATRMEDVPSFTPASRIEMAESSNDKLCEDLNAVEPVPEAQDDLNSPDASAIKMLRECRLGAKGMPFHTTQSSCYFLFKNKKLQKQAKTSVFLV